ncbi:R-spondin-1 [Electrophorus electricus]|uniref:R-spondin Fu-CRD domain-containing protein n=1 Tax=Electrophorus electricus TaxID=8005 RepID=A0A4W4EUD7_ELEEL|nr:R-spondin-1 [Electrophorus electricus]XP_026857327.1 R-spondin-1 [Electrophorus electricus]
MQLGLVALAAIFLSSMGHGDNLKVSRGRRQRQTSTDGPASCSSGCESCSEYNGCTKCRPRLFILLERNDIRQTGVCLATCPVGYYGIRNRDVNRCTQCKIENCVDCFSRTFCAKCKEGLYSHSGRCYHSCPEGLSTINSTMECAVQCELGEWSQWGPCMKKNKICGFKKGNQSRRRQPMQAPSPATVTGAASSTCAPETEIQRCSLPKRIPCGKGEKGPPKNRGASNGKSRGRDSKESGKGGGKRKNTHSPASTIRPTTTSTTT